MTLQRRYSVRVLVRLRTPVYDPQGEAVRRALAGAGFARVGTVRQGKLFDLVVEADSKEDAERVGREAAARIFANPVLEDFEVEVIPPPSSSVSASTS